MVGRFVSGAKNCYMEERKEELRRKESTGEDFKKESHPMKASSCH
jgi:hypothetical protein